MKTSEQSPKELAAISILDAEQRVDTKKPNEDCYPSRLIGMLENQRKAFVRRRSSNPLETSPSKVNDEVTSGMGLMFA